MDFIIQNKKILFVISISFLLKIIVSTIGFNGDLEHFFLWATKFETCFLASCHMPGNEISTIPLYGPLSFQLLHFLGGILKLLPVESSIQNFHIFWVFFLSVFDGLIAFFIYKDFGIKKASLYSLCPICILLIGFHSQVEILIIGLCFFGVRFYKKNWILAALLISLSLSLKQTYIYLPIWVLFSPVFGDFKNRTRFVTCIFVFLFLYYTPLFIEDLAHVQNILKSTSSIAVNGFGLDGSSVLRGLYNFFLPEGFLGKIFGPTDANYSKAYKVIFTIVILSLGFLLRKRKNPMELFILYTLCISALSPRIATQHLLLPMIAIIYFWPNFWGKVYYLMASILLPFYPENLRLAIGDETLGPLVYLSGFRSHHLQALLFCFLFIYIYPIVKEQLVIFSKKTKLI
jgi:hypothetical protein